MNGWYSQGALAMVLAALPSDGELTARETHHSAGNYHSISTTRGILNVLSACGLAIKRSVPTHRGPAGSVINFYSRADALDPAAGEGEFH